ncbi:hypothetical protein AUR64_09825 [Haloprofundus marisrubri]|uniref:Uncharacterized protein n=1 Tax=Haloprofundus marisrubri TaxID=1514971 RepID=A0A0W1R9C2_9EURY|nr:helix-turn-helix domain-containing protein [Haloprofundus marisrubri]KTG09914.1 hypothetical protein AUR64_09825 [Haloprofundus marisrubri]
MRHLRATLRHTEETTHPMHEFVVREPGFSSSNLLAWNPTPDERITMLFYVEGDAERYRAALEATDTIREYELSESGDDAFFLCVREHLSVVDDEQVRAFLESELVLVPPVTYDEDRTMTITAVGTDEALRSALSAIPDGIGVEVTQVGTYDAEKFQRGGSLTARQREAVAAAVDIGYYETPKEGTLDDVAVRLDCSPGTAGEHLRKAEQHVMRELVDGGYGGV